MQFFARFFLSFVIIIPQSLCFSAETIQNDLTLGNPEAPVRLFEYSSLTCPHCAYFHAEVLPQVKEKYINSGVLQFILIPCPSDRWAVKATALVEAVPLLKKWSILEALYKSQDDWVQAEDEEELLERLARITQLDLQFIQESISDPYLIDRILERRFSVSQKLKIHALPTFVSGLHRWDHVITMENIDKLCLPYLQATQENKNE